MQQRSNIYFSVILATVKIVKSHPILHSDVAFLITNRKTALFATYSIPNRLRSWNLTHGCQEAASFKCNAALLPSVTNCHFIKQAELDPQLLSNTCSTTHIISPAKLNHLCAHLLWIFKSYCVVIAFFTVEDRNAYFKMKLILISPLYLVLLKVSR